MLSAPTAAGANEQDSSSNAGEPALQVAGKFAVLTYGSNNTSAKDRRAGSIKLNPVSGRRARLREALRAGPPASVAAPAKLRAAARQCTKADERSKRS
mmetsp:Transcript_8395/g.20192  ORF Transcript_8395/g.20192 Transcript_8395/m.20192 type:complete len:98 (+) Transcript_8395:1529-1822(+)